MKVTPTAALYIRDCVKAVEDMLCNIEKEIRSNGPAYARPFPATALKLTLLWRDDAKTRKERLFKALEMEL
jgi:hypothetical protein